MYILEKSDALMFRIETLWGRQVAQSSRRISKRQSVVILVAAVSIQVTSPEEVTVSLNKIRNKVYER